MPRLSTVQVRGRDRGRARRIYVLLVSGRPLVRRLSRGQFRVEYSLRDISDAELDEAVSRRRAQGSIPKAFDDPGGAIRQILEGRGWEEVAVASISARRRGTGRRNSVDAGGNGEPPCLYAIKLGRPNPRDLHLYVGASSGHTATCKFSLHTTGVCVCGATDSPKPQQARVFNDCRGVKLYASKQVPKLAGRALVQAEEAWARELAEANGWNVHCNGRRFPRRRRRRRRSRSGRGTTS